MLAAAVTICSMTVEHSGHNNHHQSMTIATLDTYPITIATLDIYPITTATLDTVARLGVLILTNPLKCQETVSLEGCNGGREMVRMSMTLKNHPPHLYMC